MVPWVRVRRVAVTASLPSPHAAVLEISGSRTPSAGTASSYSRRLLGQRHSFVNIPSPAGDGWRLLISRAGDWTGSVVDRPPTNLWRRGAPVLETGSMDRLFGSVVLLVTGSGIGPAMSHIGSDGVRTHLVWIVRDPNATFGAALVDEVEQFSDGLLIWDTARDGRPDVEALARRELERTGAEALFVVSNRGLSRRLVRSIRDSGTPAYGPTWDS